MFSEVTFPVMSDSEALGYVLAELSAINQSICLRLPASEESLQQQINRIRQSQGQLEVLHQEVTRQARRRRRTAFKEYALDLPNIAPS
jgi:hypothetical protein